MNEFEFEKSVLKMYNSGYFTYEIACLLDASEWDVDKVLWKYGIKKGW